MQLITITTLFSVSHIEENKEKKPVSDDKSIAVDYECLKKSIKENLISYKGTK